MECFTNPFNQSGDELFNLVTKVVVTDDVKRDVCSTCPRREASEHVCQRTDPRRQYQSVVKDEET